MAGGQKWTFRQIGGERKTIELAGWAAPFGRPRKEPLVNDGIALRVQTRRYAGNDVPTKHVFGIQYKDWELHGRWMDAAGGSGFAQAMVANVKSFIADAQACTIGWGDVRSLTGLAEELDAKWESEADVEWTLRFSIFNDPALGTVSTVPTPRAAESYVNRITEAMTDVLHELPKKPDSLRLGFVESLDSLIAFINAPAATLTSVAGQMSDLEKGTVAEVRRFAAGLEQYKTALRSLRNTFESAPSDFALAFQDADDELSLSSSQSTFGLSMAQILAEAARADKAAADIEQSKIKAIYSAKGGDTWEQVSIAEYGSPARVKDILAANGISGGAQPVPGTNYFLPT